MYLKCGYLHFNSVLGWAGLGWAGLAFGGLGWAGLALVGVGWAGLGRPWLGWAGLCWACWLGWPEPGAFGLSKAMEVQPGFTPLSLGSRIATLSCTCLCF